jgi:perosamine synthetase
MTNKRMIPFGRPFIGDEERAAVMDVMNGPILVHGPKAKQFELDFAAMAGGGHAVSLASCTAGLHLSYVQLGIGPGDEVIVPAQTHVATAHSVEFTGARAVFVDAEGETGNIDIDRIEAAINSRTRAISVVHYLGLPVDMDRVNALARKHGLFVVEDCALAVGSYYKGKHAGLLGDIGTFSFYPVKHITTAEGGMALTKHVQVAEKIGRIKAFGYDRGLGERVVPGVYDVNMLGYNYRMNELEAAIGVAQLRKLPVIRERRLRNATVLRSGLEDIAEIELLSMGDASSVHSHYCMLAILKQPLAGKRFEVISELNGAGVGTSVYYPGPVPMLRYYRDKYGLRPEDYPQARRISDRSIALPVGPHLNEDDMKYVADSLKAAIARVK